MMNLDSRDSSALMNNPGKPAQPFDMTITIDPKLAPADSPFREDGLSLPQLLIPGLSSVCSVQHVPV